MLKKSFFADIGKSIRVIGILNVSLIAISMCYAVCAFLWQDSVQAYSTKESLLFFFSYVPLLVLAALDFTGTAFNALNKRNKERKSTLGEKIFVAVLILNCVFSAAIMAYTGYSFYSYAHSFNSAPASVVFFSFLLYLAPLLVVNIVGNIIARKYQ